MLSYIDTGHWALPGPANLGPGESEAPYLTMERNCPRDGSGQIAQQICSLLNHGTNLPM